jgi:hypothetical protein
MEEWPMAKRITAVVVLAIVLFVVWQGLAAISAVEQNKRCASDVPLNQTGDMINYFAAQWYAGAYSRLGDLEEVTAIAICGGDQATYFIEHGVIKMRQTDGIFRPIVESEVNPQALRIVVMGRQLFGSPRR